MKKILSIFAFLAFSVSVFGQAGTDRILYENTNGTAAGVYTVDNLKTYINTGVGTGTVTSVSVVTGNGFTGTVATATTTPALTLGTNVTGLLKGNGTAMSAATVRTDYGEPTTALATGILKNTTGTGAHTIAIAADFPTLNQNTTGTSANVTGIVAVANGGTGSATQNFVDLSTTQATIGGAKTFTAAMTSSGGFTASGAATFSGIKTTAAAATSIITPATTLTATGTIVAAGRITPINSATAIVLTIPSGLTIGTEKEMVLTRTSTGQVTFTASGSETINGGAAAGSYVVGANSQGVTVKLYKTTATDWAIGLRW